MLPCKFKFKAGFFWLCLFMVVMFCMLGVWQLHRYHYKTDFLVAYDAKMNAPVKSIKQMDLQDPQFQRVSASGHYLNQQTLLMQNKFYQGKQGFEVFTPLQIAGEKKLLLVDRGWIIKPQDQKPPMIEAVVSKQTITGYIKLLNEKPFTLGKNILQPDVLPLLVQKIDFNDISRVTHETYFPFVLRLDQSQSHGYVRDWVLTTVSPQRHLGYAVQWFFLALMVVGGYFCFCCERTNEN